MRGRRRWSPDPIGPNRGVTLNLSTPIVTTDKIPDPTVGPTSPSGASTANETVDHPPHYNVHPSGVECIEVVEH